MTDFNKETVRESAAQLDRAIANILRLVDSAARDSDVTHNAELMRVLHRAQGSLDAAHAKIIALRSTVASAMAMLAFYAPEKEQAPKQKAGAAA